MAQTQDQLYDDVPDPQDVAGSQYQSDTTALNRAQGAMQQFNAGANRGYDVGANMMGQATGDHSVGTPAVTQAYRISDAMRSILADVTNTAPPDEDPIDRSLRISQAVSTRMADISPQMALKANQQAVAIQEAKAQQARLSVMTAQEQAKIDEDQVKTDVAKTDASYQVHGVKTGKDGLPEFIPVGDPVSLYGPDGKKNPTFSQDLLANLAKAKEKGLDNPQYSTTDKFNNSKLAVQMARGQAQAAVAAQKAADAAQLKAAAADVPNDTLRYYAGQTALLGNSALSRQPPALRNAVTAYKAAAGIQPTDEVMAQAEIAGLKSGERAIGTRAGNTAILQNELTGLGQQVLNNLDRVNRTRFPVVNAMIRAGVTQGFDPGTTGGQGPEAALAASLQAFTTAHGRLIAGATGGITSDEARKQASDLATGTMTPEAMKASLNQIINNEVPIIRSASDGAISMMANRNKYPGINKISQALGYSIDTLAPSAAGSVPQAPPERPGQAASGPTQTPEEIRAAFKAGKMTREEATQALQKDHGFH